jgi:hypothetical protein
MGECLNPALASNPAVPPANAQLLEALVNYLVF